MATDYATSIAAVTKAVNALGYPHISPESLTALQDEAEEYGWPTGVRGHYNVVIHGFRELLAPVGEPVRPLHVCAKCEVFQAKFRCNAPQECDCPKCQNFCGCAE